MKELKWKARGDGSNSFTVYFGGIFLECERNNGRWLAYAELGSHYRSGDDERGSLEDAQEDCVILVKQILSDHHTCLVNLMKSFDVDPELE